ncbi:MULTISPECIES: DUF6261 family protein [unclassified Saccharicrinis]|uniref:DUF6261 family protein n=1 Tax=unclassified Saccharicrinis TaxID=2646859 RepID=UPI003D34BDA1
MTEKLINHSRNTDVCASIKLMITAFDQSNLSADVYLSNLFGKLAIQSEDLSEAINQTNSDSKLEEKDMNRDDIIRSFNHLLKGFKHHPNNTIKKAAEKLKLIFDKYGMGMINEGYAIESSIINALLKDLAQPDIQATIVELPSCFEICESLKKAQKDFEQAQKRDKSKMVRMGMKESATSIKKQILNTINNHLIVYLHTMKQANDAYGDFSNSIAQIIAAHNNHVKTIKK